MLYDQDYILQVEVRKGAKWELAEACYDTVCAVNHLEWIFRVLCYNDNVVLDYILIFEKNVMKLLHCLCII